MVRLLTCREKTWSSQNGNNETVDFTHNNTTYTGMTLESTAEDGTRTYKKTDTDKTVTIITVTTRELTEQEIRAKFAEAFGEGNLRDGCHSQDRYLQEGWQDLQGKLPI